jgi:DNA integrity scanning protein DisA with diadenylate cyclase activity
VFEIVVQDVFTIVFLLAKYIKMNFFKIFFIFNISTSKSLENTKKSINLFLRSRKQEQDLNLKIKMSKCMANASFNRLKRTIHLIINY